MQRSALYTMTVVIGLGTAPLRECRAQEAASAEKAQEYCYEVWGTSTKEPNRDRPWSEPFDTEAAAQARLREIQRDYAKGGLLESAPDKPLGLRIRKKIKGGAYVDSKKPKEKKDKTAGKDDEFAKAYTKEAADKLGNKRELGDRRLGSALQEYASRVADAYRNAVEAKKGLTSLVGTVTQKQFQNVNKKIDSFNGMRADFSQKAGASGGATLSLYPQLAQVTPQALKGKLASDTPSGKWVVWVYKLNNGQWEKQEDQSFSSDDQRAAQDYFNEVKSWKGFTATSNMPSPAPNLVGSSWVGESDGYTYTFLADGYSSTAPNPSYAPFHGKGRLLQRDGKLLFVGYPYGGDRELTIKGDRLYGAPFGGSYLIRKR